MRLLSLVLAAAVVASAGSASWAVGVADGATQSVGVEADEVAVETTFSLADTGEGEIRVVREYNVGSAVRTLEQTISHPMSDVSTRNVDRSGDAFEWDGSGDMARVEYVASADNLGSPRIETVRGDGYAIVGATYDGIRSDAEQLTGSVSVDGPGTAGNQFAVLGDYEAYTRSTAARDYRLVVPGHVDSADTAKAAEAVEATLDAIAYADTNLDAGVARDGEATYVLFPGSLGGRAGTAIKPLDASDGPGDVLLVNTNPVLGVHEAVHQLKQAHEVGRSARWTTEGTASYYGHLLAWERGQIDFRQFVNGLNPITPGARLNDPDTWQSRQTAYGVGSRVAARLDREIRAETDGERTLDAVLRRMNHHNGPVTHEDFAAFVTDVGGPALEPVVERYVTTDAVPAEPSNPYVYTDPSIESELSFAASEANVTAAGRFPNLEVSLENSGSDPATAVGFNVSMPDDWSLLGVAPTEKGAQYQQTDPVPGADIGYFQVPAGETRNFTVYLQRPDDRSAGNHEYAVAARDLSGQSATRTGTVTAESSADGAGDASSETELAEGAPPSSALDVAIGESDILGRLTVENQTVPVVNRSGTVNVTMDLENETYAVDSYVFEPITGPSSRSGNGTFAYTPESHDDDVAEWETRATLENGEEVRQLLRVVVNDAPEVYVSPSSRSDSSVRLEADVHNEYGNHTVEWYVDGEQVGTGETYRQERTDQRVEVTAVARDEFGATREGQWPVGPKPSPLSLDSFERHLTGTVPLAPVVGLLLVGSILVSWLRNR